MTEPLSLVFYVCPSEQGDLKAQEGNELVVTPQLTLITVMINLFG